MNELQKFVNEKIGQPMTLARVLNVLYEYTKENCEIAIKIKNKNLMFGFLFGESTILHIQFIWQLLNDNGTDCLFCQQSEETQLLIAQLLWEG